MDDPLAQALQPKVNFWADLDCQTCGVYVPGGWYNGQRLTWRCPDGHESVLEKFHVG